MAIFGTIKGLDLFSGIGGLTVALAPWVRPVAYCEIDRYAQGILLSKMGTGKLPMAPIWDDVRTLHRGIIAGHTKGSHDDGESIDIITGGFPCQDISITGLGAGLEGERSRLFYEISRLTGELRPRFVFLENVPAITSRGGLEVVGAFTEMGYDCRWCVTSSGHGLDGFRGNRWFLLAKAKSERLQEFGWRPEESRSSQCVQEIGMVGFDLEIVPSFCRAPNGLSRRVDRVRGLGNAVVPQQAREAFKLLMGIEQDRKEIRTV